MTNISNRKDDHIELALSPDHQYSPLSRFDEVCFEHNPLPDLIS